MSSISNKKKQLNQRTIDNLDQIGRLEEAANDRDRAARIAHFEARNRFEEAQANNDTNAMAVEKLIMVRSKFQRKSAIRLSFSCGKIIDEFTTNAFDAIENEGTLDRLISEFRLINKSIKAEAKKIKDLKKSIDKAVQVLKMAEDLFKKFASVI